MDSECQGGAESGRAALFRSAHRTLVQLAQSFGSLTHTVFGYPGMYNDSVRPWEIHVRQYCGRLANRIYWGILSSTGGSVCIHQACQEVRCRRYRGGMRFISRLFAKPMSARRRFSLNMRPRPWKIASFN